MELVVKGAEVHCTSPSGHTALHLARDPELAKFLINHGADVNAVDNGGFTPLHSAAWTGALDVVKIFIDAGAKNLRNKQNQLPVDSARASPHNERTKAEVIEVLSRLPVPEQGNQTSTGGQLAAAAQQEKSTVDTGNVTTITTRELDENSGKNLLEEQLNKQNAAAIGWLGTFNALAGFGRGDNWETKLLGYESQSRSKALQTAGLVIYTEEHRAPALPGMVTHVTIKPTPLIQPYVQEKDGYGWFEIPSPKYKINEIVKKDRYQGPVGEIAFLAGTLDVDVNPTYLMWAKALHPNNIQGLAAQSKFRTVLLKDPVEDSWKVSSIDIANKGSEFFSHQAELPPFGLTKVK